MARKQVFGSVDDAYRELVPELTNYARRHLLEPDKALDAVHDAFSKFLSYKQKHPSANVSRHRLWREVQRACRRINRSNRMFSLEAPETQAILRAKKPEYAYDVDVESQEGPGQR